MNREAPDYPCPGTRTPDTLPMSRRSSRAPLQGFFVCDDYVQFHCPLACRQSEQCYGAYLETQANNSAWANVWNRIHRFDASETLCLSQSFFAAREQLHKDCVARGGLTTKRRVEAHAAAYNWSIFDSLEAQYPDMREYKRFSKVLPGGAGGSIEPPKTGGGKGSIHRTINQVS